MRYFRIFLLCILISLSCSYIIMSCMVYSSNEIMTGSDLIEEVIIAIVLGIAIGLLSLIFWLDIPFTSQLLLHFIGIIAVVYTAGYFGNWYDVSDLSTVGVIFLLILIIYGITWWIIHTLLRINVEELNKKIKKRRGELK